MQNVFFLVQRSMLDRDPAKNCAQQRVKKVPNPIYVNCRLLFLFLLCFVSSTDQIMFVCLSSFPPRNRSKAIDVCLDVVPSQPGADGAWRRRPRRSGSGSSRPHRPVPPPWDTGDCLRGLGGGNIEPLAAVRVRARCTSILALLSALHLTVSLLGAVGAPTRRIRIASYFMTFIIFI